RATGPSRPTVSARRAWPSRRRRAGPSRLAARPAPLRVRVAAGRGDCWRGTREIRRGTPGQTRGRRSRGPGAFPWFGHPGQDAFVLGRLRKCRHAEFPGWETHPEGAAGGYLAALIGAGDIHHDLGPLAGVVDITDPALQL